MAAVDNNLQDNSTTGTTTASEAAAEEGVRLDISFEALSGANGLVSAELVRELMARWGCVGVLQVESS
jgi:hypothetical protein